MAPVVVISLAPLRRVEVYRFPCPRTVVVRAFFIVGGQIDAKGQPERYTGGIPVALIDQPESAVTEALIRATWPRGPGPGWGPATVDPWPAPPNEQLGAVVRAARGEAP